MNGKVTKHSPPYPKGFHPDYIEPVEYREYRFGIGKMGTNPLVAICMNPSAARDDSSDSTINRIIGISQKLGMDGWIVFNTYPERATNKEDIIHYDKELSMKNINTIFRFLKEREINEVYVAWGDDEANTALSSSKKILVERMKKEGVAMYYFGTLTKAGNPRHPLQRYEKQVHKVEYKKFL